MKRLSGREAEEITRFVRCCDTAAQQLDYVRSFGDEGCIIIRQFALADEDVVLESHATMPAQKCSLRDDWEFLPADAKGSLSTAVG